MREAMVFFRKFNFTSFWWLASISNYTSNSSAAFFNYYNFKSSKQREVRQHTN